MRGHVRRRGPSWSIVYDLPNGATGKRQQKWQGGFRTRKEAEQALADVLQKLAGGNFVEPSKLTMAEYLREWLPARRTAGLRPSTLVGYEVMVEKHVIPRIGHVLLQKLTPLHLDTLYAELLESGRRQRKGGLSPRTVRYTHTIIRKALADAMRKGLVTRNVADAAEPPSASAAKADVMRTWTAAQLQAFLGHVRDHRLYAAFLLAAMTGMRRGEVLGLR
jgi:integrase